MQTVIKQCVLSVILVLAGPTMALTCAKCGGYVLATDSFCQKCGADVIKSLPQLSYYQGNENSYAVRNHRNDTVYFSCGIFSPFIAVSLPYPDAGVYLKGVSLGAFFGYYRDVYGVDVGFNLWTDRDVTGLSVAGMINITKGSVNGCQIGLINMVGKDVAGVQIGMINTARNLQGVQIGVINGNSGGAVPFFPVINVGW